jgi:hypothetical protein
VIVCSNDPSLTILCEDDDLQLSSPQVFIKPAAMQFCISLSEAVQQQLDIAVQSAVTLSQSSSVDVSTFETVSGL